MAGWYHWLNGHEFECAPGDGEGQRSLACCSPWGRKGSDTAEQLNNRSIFLGLPLFVLTPRTMYRHCLMLSHVIYHDPLLFNGLPILNFSNYSSWDRSLFPFFILWCDAPTWLLTCSFWRLNLAVQKKSCTNKAMLTSLWLLYS